jgi:biotin carboxylase
MSEKIIIALIEPCYYGMGFVDAAINKGLDFVAIVSDKNNPKIYGYEGKFKDLIVADIREPGNIIKAIKESQYKKNLDAIIPATDYVVHIGAIVAKEFGLKHMPYEAIIKARLKDETRKGLQKNNLPNAKFFCVKNFEEAKVAANLIGYPVVLKPTNCACSQNVSLIYNESELSNAFQILVNFDESYLKFKVRKVFLVEEYIRGEEFSVEIFMNDGKILYAYVTEKIKTDPPYFVELAHIIPASIINKDQSDKLVKAAANYLNVLGLKDGVSHVEMRLSEKGPIIMEINPRPGGDRISQDLLPNAFGINSFATTIDWYLGHSLDVTPKKNLASAISFLTFKRNGIIKKVSGIENVSKMSGIVKNTINIKQGDMVKIPKSSDDRYGYIISIGKTPIEAKESVYRALEQVKIEME